MQKLAAAFHNGLVIFKATIKNSTKFIKRMQFPCFDALSLLSVS